MANARRVLDHITIGVSDLARSRAFYRVVLAPLGLSERGSWDAQNREVTFGPPDGEADFAISDLYPSGAPVHVAFCAPSLDAVRGFHAAAVAADGRDNGTPGLRENYSPGYFGAFVLDPDGHNIEAVHHVSQPASAAMPQPRAAAGGRRPGSVIES